jgi:hypothetical protein
LNLIKLDRQTTNNRAVGHLGKKYSPYPAAFIIAYNGLETITGGLAL